LISFACSEERETSSAGWNTNDNDDKIRGKKAQEEAARNHKVAFGEVETKNAFRWKRKSYRFLHWTFQREKIAKKVKF
jgi:hypothetical protein